MATDQERLLLTLEAQTRNFERALEQSERLANRRFDAIERRANQMVQKTQREWNNFATQARTALATLGVGIAVRDVVGLADTWTTVANRISFAGVAAERVAATQQAIADIASRTRSDLDATADLYARMFRSSSELGLSQERVLRLTETVNQALAGAAQSERASAIRQFGQGLGSGRFMGDELRSILENSRPIAEAIAAEFNTTVGGLKDLGAQGALVADRVVHAIEAAAPRIEAAFQRTNFTVADSFTRLRTEAARFVGTNENTSQSVRNLTGLIDNVANNFHLLADAVLVSATVIGGSFAGTAVARAILALNSLVLAEGAAINRAKALDAAFKFFGGTFGIGLTALAGTLAVLATQTDVFTASAERAARANDSLAAALGIIVGLEPAAADTAAATGDLADQATRAGERIDQLATASQGATPALNAQERATRALALVERDRVLNTLRQAQADQRAIIQAEDRARDLRALQRFLNSDVGGTQNNERAARNRARLDREDAAGQQRRQQALDDELQIRNAIADVSSGRRVPGAGGSTANNTPTPPASARPSGSRGGSDLDDLRTQAAISLARLQHEEARVRELEDAEQIEKRTAAFINAGLSATEARASAERDVAAERAAMNVEAQRSYELDQLQNEIELARLNNNIGLADSMSDQLDIKRQTRDIAEQLRISEEEAAERARQRVEERRAAINRQREISLETRDLETQAEAARLAGDERREASLRRQLELRNAIEQLRADGMSESAAIARAEAELATLEQADLRGKFRDWFSGGVMAALDGDLDDFFENWIRERAARGLENALDSVADILFESFSGVLTSVMQSGQDGIGQAIAAVFTGGATGGLNTLGAESQKAGEALGTVLAASAAQAATSIALTGTAAVASATREAGAASVKQTAASIELNAMLKLAASANAAAAALSRIAATGGATGGAGNLFSGIVGAFGGGGGGGGFLGGVSSIFSSIFGGFRAGGGPMQAGVGYMVGERGRELVIPQTPSFVVPNSALGGSSVTVVERNTFNITGASTAEMAQLRQQLNADLASRRTTTVQIVREALKRPRGLG